MSALNVLQQLQNGSSCSCLLLLFILPVQGGQGQQLPACFEGEAGRPGFYAPLVPTRNPDCRSSAPCFCLQHMSAVQHMHCSLCCTLQPRLPQLCSLLLPAAHVCNSNDALQPALHTAALTATRHRTRLQSKVQMVNCVVYFLCKVNL